MLLCNTGDRGTLQEAWRLKYLPYIERWQTSTRFLNDKTSEKELNRSER